MGEFPDISVIIPVFNEAQRIRACIRHIRSIDADVQIIVCDGGSTDMTCDEARSEDIVFCRASRGRGIQCNEGARHATGAILMFAHVDTDFPANSFRIVRSVFTDPRSCVGTFRLRFDLDHWFLRLCGFLTRFDTVLTRFGDQVITARKSFFDSLGGFPDWPLFEDMRFLSKARKRARILSFPATVRTSARKFVQNGVFRQQWRNGLLIARYWVGASPFVLARAYERSNGVYTRH